MITLPRFEVRSFDVDHLDLYWEIGTTSEDLGLYEVTIERSESPGGPFDHLAGPLQDTYRFRDSTINPFHAWRVYYYRLVYRHKVSGEEITFGPVSVGPPPSLEATEIAKLFELKLREFTGRKHWLLKRRTMGQTCSCKDKLTNRRTESNCLACWGVGIVGGYYAPMEILLQTVLPTVGPHFLPTGITDVRDRSVQAPWRPMISPQDLIIDPENVRYRVHSSTPGGTRLGVATRQDLMIHELPTSSIEYKIPLNVNEFTMQVDPAREMTLPSSV